MDRLSPTSPTIRTQVCLPEATHQGILKALRARARKTKERVNFSAWVRTEGEKLIRQTR